MKRTSTFYNWDKIPVLMSIEQACALLDLSDKTVVKYVRQGLIKGNKLGGKWRVNRDSVGNYFEGGVSQ